MTFARPPAGTIPDTPGSYQFKDRDGRVIYVGKAKSLRQRLSNYFVDPALLPKGPVRVAALDGENSDPANGLTLEPGLRAKTLWGELAWQLGGKAVRPRRAQEFPPAEPLAGGTGRIVLAAR